MSKKPQPQKENLKNKPQIVEQQNEPFLRTLQKKVRNINKKLADIAELEGKENLKVEQVEKINRKGTLIEERARIEEIATLFKQTYVENAAHYRANQLKELQILARSIAVFHAGGKLPENDKLASLWHAIEQGDKTFSTINESIASLSATLKDFANDKKLQKALTAYVQEHGNSKIAPIVSNEEKIVSDILDEKVQVKPEPVKEVKEEVVIPAVVVQAPVIVIIPEPEPKVESAPVAVVQKVEEAPRVAVEAEPTPLTQPVASKENKPVGEGNNYNNRNYRDNRGRGDNRGGRGGYKGNNRRQGEDNREKRQYRPKYTEKDQAVEEKKEDNDESSDSEPEVRNFRNEEIKQLENEGFIFVGKPKPKARDPKEQRQAHNKQHGKKHHYPPPQQQQNK